MRKDEIVNDIILGQACRHCIVHEGGRVNIRTIKQVANAKPRSIKPSISENDQLEFTTAEAEKLGEYMKEYVEKLQAEITAYNKHLQIDAAKPRD